MTIATKTTIKTYFETGDFPTQSNFTDLIDSFLGLGETASQTIKGPIIVSGVAAFPLGITVSGNALGTTAFLNTGVSANNIPKLDSSNRLPAVDGSLLTNIAAGAQKLLSTQTASNSATVDFTTNIDSTYSHYIIEISNLVADSIGQLLQALVRQGGSFVTAANYNSGTYGVDQVGSSTLGGNAPGAQFNITGGGVNTAHPMSVIVHMFQPNLTTGTMLFWQGIAATGAATIYAFSGGGGYNSTVATTGLRFQFSSGNILTGTFKLYGVS